MPKTIKPTVPYHEPRPPDPHDQCGRKQQSLTFAILALTLIGPATAATTVTSWSYATATLATSLAPTAGATTVAAFNIGGSNSSLGGVNFSAANAGNPGTTLASISLTYSVPTVKWATSFGGFYSTGTNVLASGGYTTESTGLLEFSGLTIGNTYTFQFIVADSRGAPKDTFQIVGTTTVGGADVTGTSARQRYAYTTGEYGVISATFTADSTKAAFSPQNFNEDNSSAGTQINAVHIMTVPEPAAALLGGLGLLALLLRRRRC